MFSTKISPNDRVGNKIDSDQSLELLISLMSENGFTNIQTYPKNSHEQVHLGIDLSYDFKGEHYTADHKSRSRKWGHKGLFSLEYVNNAGQTGSLFKGTQDVFILEGSRNFVFVEPKNLRELFLVSVDVFSAPIVSGSKESMDSINKIPKIHTLLTRSNYPRWWDDKPNEDEFAWFNYYEILPFINFKLPIT